MEHLGRLLVQLRVPPDGQERGASTPVQPVQVPPFALQSPVKAQLENPPNVTIVQLSPETLAMFPLGCRTVTPQGPIAWLWERPSHTAGSGGNGPPPVVLMASKVKSATGGQSVGRVVEVVVVELLVGAVLVVDVVVLVVVVVGAVVVVVGPTHCTRAIAVAMPLVPREHDGRLLAQLGVPATVTPPVQTTGVSAPVQSVQPPPRGVQGPKKSQLKKPMTLMMAQ